MCFPLQAAGTLTSQAEEEGLKVILPPSRHFYMFLSTQEYPSVRAKRGRTSTLTSFEFALKVHWEEWELTPQT